MATKTITWSDGSTATLTYNGQGSGTITVQSDPNNHYDSRSAQITVKTTNGSPVVTKTVTISQAACPFVDLGLPSGLLWATCNVGASKPEEFGLYFSWGNAVGHVGGTYNFSADNYSSTPGKALTTSIPQNSTYDGAIANTGGKFRMHSIAEAQELIGNTDQEYVANYNGTGVSGKKFMKKTDHSVYIFIPFAGRYNGTTLESVTTGRSWCTDYNSSSASSAFALSVTQNSASPNNSNGKRYGFAIRGVCELI